MNEPLHQEKRAGGIAIYFLPNLLTTAGIFAGFYAIIAAMKGQFVYAIVAIFIAMITDSLDGRVARLVNATSEFGVQYDSLSDMVSFGIAPAVIAYSWSLHALGKLGWLAAFFYAAAGALRLARFNAMAAQPETDKSYFIGLPIPAAAACIIGTVWVLNNNHIVGHWVTILFALWVAAIAILKVSNVHYYSFKDFDFKSHIPFIALLLVVVIFIAIALDPPEVLWAIFVIYALSGPLLYLKKKKRNKAA